MSGQRLVSADVSEPCTTCEQPEETAPAPVDRLGFVPAKRPAEDDGAPVVGPPPSRLPRFATPRTTYENSHRPRGPTAEQLSQAARANLADKLKRLPLEAEFYPERTDDVDAARALQPQPQL